MDREIGRIIKEMRVEKKITINDLARGLCSDSAFSYFEGGKQKLDNLMLCRVFDRIGIEIDEFSLMVDEEQYAYHFWKKQTLEAVEKEDWKGLGRLLANKNFLSNYSKWNLDRMFNTQNTGWMDYAKMEMPTDKELLTQNEIVEIQENMESVFEVDFMADYILYTYTVDRLQEVVEYEQKYEEDMNKIVESEEDIDEYNVTDADEGVVIVFQQGYESIPYTFIQVSRNVTGATWSVDNYCTVTVSEDGIEGLEMMNPYDIEEEAGEVRILSFGEFIEKHIQMREGVDTTVVSVGLYYLPIYTGEDLRFITKTVWCVQTERIEDLGYPFREWDVYDAVTGEELLWQE